MASAKTATPSTIAATTLAALSLPEGYALGFTRVEMQPGVRIDDGLACVAMLTYKPLAEITQLAYKLGLPQHGPAWVSNDLIRKLLAHYDLIGSDDKEVMSTDALPYVAMIAADFDAEADHGRWVLWHHAKATDKHTAVSVVYDPAYWIEPSQHITKDFKGLLTPKEAIYYSEVTPRPVSKSKAK